ncbi:hypothetical protein QYF36_010245 [Acer negundo]|nr:hypothetical protein QYF36_010245 [Acer negundo]
MLIDVHDHGIASPDEKDKVACNYCGKEVNGFYRLKCHLGHLRGDVKPYISLKMNCSTSAKNTSKQADSEQIEEHVRKVKDSWAVTGCSIVIDEWEDDKRRRLINFLADSPEGRHVQDLISQQLQKYEHGEGVFKDGSTLQGLQDASPTEWWSRYGAQCPKLQKLAIRIPSQTCDGILGFDLKRSLAEELLSRKKTTNQIDYEYLLDTTYVQCNVQLQNTKSKALSDLYVSTEEADPMDD